MNRLPYIYTGSAIHAELVKLEFEMQMNFYPTNGEVLISFVMSFEYVAQIHIQFVVFLKSECLT